MSLLQTLFQVRPMWVERFELILELKLSLETKYDLGEGNDMCHDLIGLLSSGSHFKRAFGQYFGFGCITQLAHVFFVSTIINIF